MNRGLYDRKTSGQLVTSRSALLRIIFAPPNIPHEYQTTCKDSDYQDRQWDGDVDRLRNAIGIWRQGCEHEESIEN